MGWTCLPHNSQSQKIYDIIKSINERIFEISKRLFVIVALIFSVKSNVLTITR